MNIINWEEESRRFNEAADYYDVYRPGYPSEVVSLLEEKVRLRAASKILEVGAGSGKASELFLNRGYELLCIEPGPQLAELGLRKHEGKRVEFVVTRYEEWNEPEGYFDLIFSAQAFHWVPKPIGYEKSATALKADGQLALFWNMYLYDKDTVYVELMDFCKVNYLVPFQNHNEIEHRILEINSEISDSGYFRNPTVYQFPWTKSYNTEEFVGFLRTGNGFLSLSQFEQERVVNEVTTILTKHDNQIEVKYLTTLFLTNKNEGV
jgi:SAM-dependent methyltransferase